MLLFALAWMPFACGSSNNSPDAGDPDGSIGCINDPRAQIYTANMQQKGIHGLLTFVLLQSNPAPPVKGTNTWGLKLVDNAGNPVPGATINVIPYMPDHGHGTSVVPAVMPAADGYSVSSLYLFMAGLWQVTLDVQSPAGNDAAVFNFCVQG